MLRRFGVMTALILTVATTIASPASARSMYLSQTSGMNADASWTQYDNIPVGEGTFGNVHVGWLSVYSTGQDKGEGSMYIDDFDCEPGQEPWGGHGEEEEPGCAYIGSRFGWASGLDFTMDRKLNQAHVTGSIELFGGGHGEGDGGPVGTPGINVTWTGIGDTARVTSTFRWVEGGTTYSDRYRASYRPATLTGNIGVMGFDPATSYGSMSVFNARSQSRTR